MTKSTLKRVVIIGNSGSGKTWLATALANLLHFPVIHFDKHFWESGGFNKTRPKDIVFNEIATLSNKTE